MILVLLGTQEQQFNRLVEYVEKLIEDNNITDEIIIQLGETRYNFENTNVKFYKYLDDYEMYLTKADLVITHGGVGSIQDGLRNKKKIIAIPRNGVSNEHVDNHQYEICKKLCDEQYIFCCETYDELNKRYQEINYTESKNYISNNEEFNKKLNNLIIDLIGE